MVETPPEGVLLGLRRTIVVVAIVGGDCRKSPTRGDGDRVVPSDGDDDDDGASSRDSRRRRRRRRRQGGSERVDGVSHHRH